MQRLKPLFPEITSAQWALLERMASLHREWNAKINLVSRKDIDNLEWHHYAPCVAAVKFLRLMNGATVLDVGTGGGFPGLILAALYPQARFTLADSVGKKITVVADIAQRLDLRNVEARNIRVETLRREYDFVTGRAVTSLPAFIQLIRAHARPGEKSSPGNGVIYWKGGALAAEEEALGIAPSRVLSLAETLADAGDYFHEKYIVHYRQRDLARAKPPVPTDGVR
ncbi:16S rRNA (guanine527-N7)-methyltransferase [Ereboglobus sp. PH5-5]|uniref:16S rRNA (guanine(527)-N(7))-methyltransferase RsmG n=1 Tax=unclassified Ereboglobus TaxID=2626932 RepID=UPI00240598C7|nr:MULTISPECIES: RsmG family class I SAM-dependent methyltransferase [unclassified Ereboglobus]MDF9826689.1 16S rRNA (guanine527-N7)-methyltransferase [Ereboglobus sp. PH5-10]MDF9833423.1 16S rRNA (guanine527-N7)-methyltransferase [Ereboglobus sp. PH5-5]